MTQHIRSWTRTDPILSGALHFISHGWPDVIDPKFVSYSSKTQELSSQDGCVLWGSRVVIPIQGREGVLQELHQGHPGISWMKSLSRMYI